MPPPRKASTAAFIGGIGTLLKGADVPSAASGLIEIYSGKQTADAVLGDGAG